jgi:Flp pilus assembly protein TadD
MRLIIELDKAVRSEEHAETISVTRLRQKPSRAATRELRLAQKASGQNQMDESIVHLRRAVELAPEMQDAHNNLGAKYLRCADYEAAVRELEIAVALDPGNPMPHLNLSLALLALNRTVEAQDHARSALRRDPLSPGGNFVTGVILDRQGRSDEALRHLEISSTHVSEALLIEARILFARSEMGGAITKLREYVSRPGSPRRAEVTRWLEEISAHDAH